MMKPQTPSDDDGAIEFNSFAPTGAHAGQLQVMEDPARFKVLRAGRKWRKTSLDISWLVERALETGLVCPFIAPELKQAKNIVWRDHLMRMTDEMRRTKMWYKINQTELYIEFENGGRVQLAGSDNYEALRGVSNWGAVVMDEYDDWKEDIWAYVIRPNLIVHKAPAIASGTPKGKRGIYRLTQNPRWKSFHFTSLDNPDLDKEELDDLIAEYRELGEAAYRQEILAEFIKPEGVVYEEFDGARQVLDVPYDPVLPVHVTWDFGVNDPTALVVIQPNGSELRVIGYYEAANANLSHFVQWLRAQPWREAALHTGDIAGKARNLVTGTSPIEELAKNGIFIRYSSIPDIPSQIRATHKYIPRLLIDRENAGGFVDVLENYRYPKKTDTAVNQSNEIPIHDKFSHGARAFEYYVWNVYRQPIDAHLNTKPARPREYDSSGRLIS